MARTKQTDRASGIAQSRIATTPVDRLRVAKQQLQTSNNAQTKLHTMFEDMMQELQETKDKLKATESELDATKIQLATAKVQARKARTYYVMWLEDYNRYQEAESALETQEQTIQQLKLDLAREEERAEMNDNAQEKLERLKNQWSSLSHILGSEDAKH